MKGYSWSREDFRELLYAKYKPMKEMKEAIYIMGNDCSKCHLLHPHVVERATVNGYSLQEFLFDDENVKEFQIDSVPMLVLREDGVVTAILDYDEIVNFISNQKKDGEDGEDGKGN